MAFLESNLTSDAMHPARWKPLIRRMGGGEKRRFAAVGPAPLEKRSREGGSVALTRAGAEVDGGGNRRDEADVGGVEY